MKGESLFFSVQGFRGGSPLTSGANVEVTDVRPRSAELASREHQQAEMLQTSGLSDADIAELAGSSRSSEDSDET